MKEKFRDWNPSVKTLELLGDISSVLSEYAGMDIRLTLRQLYYQLVTKNIIANKKEEYSKLSTTLTNARLAGLVDWTAIEDRVRRPERHSEWDSIADLVKSAVYSYRLPRWANQPNYVELWCEKDALHSVIQPITDDLHVTLMVNRGYSSSSAMYDSAERFKHNEEKRCTILYLGDFDPSGEDMVRDIKDRMEMFQMHLSVEKIALNHSHIAQYKLPPNPAKITDPRAGEFIKKYGSESYEVDALPPQVLMKLVRDSIEELMDLDSYEIVRRQEAKEKIALQKAALKI
jgi:hypothetical protein